MVAPVTSINETRSSGISVVGERPWGTHFCSFYESKSDLLSMLLSYFKAGLEANEFCVWVLTEPLSERDAWDGLRSAVPDFDSYVARRSIEILDGRDWYLKGGAFDPTRVMSAWNEKLDRGLDRGYAGLRGSGNTAWLQKKDWNAFSEYEQLVNDSVVGRAAMLLCTYSLKSCGATELLDVVHTHQFAMAMRHGDWELVETPELKQAKAEIKKKEWERAAKMEALGRRAGGIAHDFNNILGAILGYGELAQDALSLGDKARRYVDQVMQAGSRGKGLVERILTFSQGALGERAPLGVQPIVEEVLDLLGPSLPAGVRLQKQLEAADAAMMGDATQFHELTMNLCSNAVQAIEGGGVITVTLERRAPEERCDLSHGVVDAGRYVCLSVSDTGAGIAPSVLQRIFDPFFTTKQRGKGTGLGLTLVQTIVADFGGSIDVVTRVGVGSTFTVWLPEAPDNPIPRTDPRVEAPHGCGQTVMIVDDEPMLVALAEETLTELGYQPVGFASSTDALEAFCRDPGRFDLVLTDETMPELTGTELTRDIRKLRPDISVIMMSGHSGEDLSERARAAGVCELIRKPLVRSDIAVPLARAVQKGH
jgi:signal transduction histidine kinase/ActR/RegA family two-component response regulator